MDVGGNGPADLAVADVNGDGIDDLLVTNRVSSDVTVLVNNGEGFFSEQRFRAGGGAFGITGDGTSLVSGDTAAAAAPADFNGDGQLELLVSDHGTQSLALLMGQGSGSDPQTYFNFTSFANPVHLALPFRPGLLAAGHFTSATDSTDVAILNPQDDTLAI